MGRIRDAAGWLDRVGGKVVYRTTGTLVAVMSALSGFASWDLLFADGRSGGDRAAGVVFGVCAVLLAWFAVWCFSPKRRLSDMG